jgi:HK97 gp10 family phage protein
MADKFVDVRVEGLDELTRRFDTVPPKIAKAIIRRALKASAQVFLSAMIGEVRRRTGFLAAHLGLRVRLTRDEYGGTASVGALKVNYPLDTRGAQLPTTGRPPNRSRISTTISADAVARFLEFGTRKMPAFPFIRRSFESEKSTALATFVSAAKAGFQEGAR